MRSFRRQRENDGCGRRRKVEETEVPSLLQGTGNRKEVTSGSLINRSPCLLSSKYTQDG